MTGSVGNKIIKTLMNMYIHSSSFGANSLRILAFIQPIIIVLTVALKKH